MSSLGWSSSQPIISHPCQSIFNIKIPHDTTLVSPWDWILYSVLDTILVTILGRRGYICDSVDTSRRTLITWNLRGVQKIQIHVADFWGNSTRTFSLCLGGGTTAAQGRPQGRPNLCKILTWGCSISFGWR